MTRLQAMPVRVEQRPRVGAGGERRIFEDDAENGHGEQWRLQAASVTAGDYSSVCQTTTGYSRPSRLSSARACAIASP
jgi:hypothetical protein